MKIFIQVVDSRTGIHQSGMIDEPTKKGFEIPNALGHFGINQLDIDWEYKTSYENIINLPKVMTGVVKDTSKPFMGKNDQWLLGPVYDKSMTGS